MRDSVRGRPRVQTTPVDGKNHFAPRRESAPLGQIPPSPDLLNCKSPYVRTIEYSAYLPQWRVARIHRPKSNWRSFAPHREVSAMHPYHRAPLRRTSRSKWRWHHECCAPWCGTDRMGARFVRSVSSLPAAIAAAFGKTANNVLLTSLTRASVHCALKRAITKSLHGSA